MKVAYKFVILILTFIATATSIELLPRRASNCAYLVDRIYCYGGYIKGASASSDSLSALDINNGQPYQNLNSQWTPVTTQPTNIYLDFRGCPQAVPLPDGKRFLFQGGYNYDKALEEQTIVYNAETNSWSTLPNYFEASNGGNRQIYYGTGVALPDINAVGFYGGYQQHVQLGSNFNTPYGTSIPGLTFNNSEGFTNSYAGFYYFTLLDLNSNTWMIPQQYNTPLDFHIMKSVTYHPGTKKIFYLGGSYYNSTSQTLFSSYLTYATTFDTTTTRWKYEDLSGPDYPKQRNMHTATLLPDGENILLYGGTYDDTTALMDYCYTLNVPKMQWTFHNLNAPIGVSGPRAYHAAVLVNNTSLFILFGLTKDATSTNDLLILDVRNVNNLTFADRYPFDQIGSSSPTNNNTNSTFPSSSNGNSSGLSTGAIAGIAVGCGITGILSIIAIIFFVRRNKKNQHHQYSNATQPNGPNNNSDNPIVDMDWDRMNGQVYREIEPPSSFIQRTSTIEPPQQFIRQQNIPTVERPHQEFSQQQQRVSVDYVSEPSSATAISPDGSYPLEPPHRKVVMKAVKPDGGF